MMRGASIWSDSTYRVRYQKLLSLNHPLILGNRKSWTLFSLAWNSRRRPLAPFSMAHVACKLHTRQFRPNLGAGPMQEISIWADWPNGRLDAETEETMNLKGLWLARPGF